MTSPDPRNNHPIRAMLLEGKHPFPKDIEDMLRRLLGQDASEVPVPLHDERPHEHARREELAERVDVVGHARDQTTDRLIVEVAEHQVGTASAYLADLAQRELSPNESGRALELILYISNLEHAGDVIQLNLADRIRAKAKESIAFTAEEQASLDELCQIIQDNIRLATGVISSSNVEGAKRLIAQKDAFRGLENKVLDEHFRLGGRGKDEALRRSALYVDMIRDLHRINSHIVSAGYPIVEAAGLLRDSRLRGNEVADAP